MVATSTWRSWWIARLWKLGGGPGDNKSCNWGLAIYVFLGLTALQPSFWVCLLWGWNALEGRPSSSLNVRFVSWTGSCSWKHLKLSKSCKKHELLLWASFGPHANWSFFYIMLTYALWIFWILFTVSCFLFGSNWWKCWLLGGQTVQLHSLGRVLGLEVVLFFQVIWYDK